jgi:hypothetical protein
VDFFFELDIRNMPCCHCPERATVFPPAWIQATPPAEADPKFEGGRAFAALRRVTRLVLSSRPHSLLSSGVLLDCGTSGPALHAASRVLLRYRRACHSRARSTGTASVRTATYAGSLPRSASAPRPLPPPACATACVEPNAKNSASATVGSHDRFVRTENEELIVSPMLKFLGDLLAKLRIFDGLGPEEQKPHDREHDDGSDSANGQNIEHRRPALPLPGFGRGFDDFSIVFSHMLSRWREKLN